MTLLYACQLLCFFLMPLAIVTGQGFFIGPLGIIAYLIRRQAVLEQQIAYLLSKDTQRNAAQHWRDNSVTQVPRVKGV